MDDVRKEMGISVILDASQQVIVSADTTLDLTNADPDAAEGRRGPGGQRSLAADGSRGFR